MSDLKTNKLIKIVMPDTSVWIFPAIRVAAERAIYYADADKNKNETTDWDTVFEKEYEITLNDNLELIDWFNNNMNWADIEPHITMIQLPEGVDYSVQFKDAERKIINDVQD